MTTQNIVAQLRAERDKIDRALEALTGRKSTAVSDVPQKPPKPKKSVPPELRARIAATAKKRWAERKAAQAAAAAQATPAT